MMTMPQGYGAPPNAGLWAGLGAAQVFENGTYFGPGVYDVEIVRCLSKNTQKSGLAFIVETEILTSTNPEHASGTKRTWFQSMKNMNVGFGAVAGFLMNVFDLENTAARRQDFFPYLESFMRRVDGPENVLSGIFVHVECTMIKTRERGSDFTRHDWRAFDYDGMGISAPKWEDYRSAQPAYNAMPELPPGAQLSGDGKLYWAPGMPAWAPVPLPVGVRVSQITPSSVLLGPPAKAWTPSPPAPPPPPLPRVWTPPPGGQLSGDGKLYWVPGMPAWAPVPA